MKFLVDECLHTSLVEVAQAHGHEATHVTWRGWSGRQDWNLMDPILDEDFTFVTNNVKDFRRLYGARALHAGLVIVVRHVPPEIQRRLFDAVLDHIPLPGDLTNEVIEIVLDNHRAVISRYSLAAGRT